MGLDGVLRRIENRLADPTTGGIVETVLDPGPCQTPVGHGDGCEYSGTAVMDKRETGEREGIERVLYT